jgi:hypothetical protein
MKIKLLNILFVAVIVVMVIFFIALILVNIFSEEEKDIGALKDITGTVQNFEVYHGNSNPQYVHVRTSERYDDKYLEYLEHIKDRRDNTFLR